MSKRTTHQFRLAQSAEKPFSNKVPRMEKTVQGVKK